VVRAKLLEREKGWGLKGRARHDKLPIAGIVTPVAHLFRFLVHDSDLLDLSGFDILDISNVVFQLV
jgi:hypothetical protein